MNRPLISCFAFALTVSAAACATDDVEEDELGFDELDVTTAQSLAQRCVSRVAMYRSQVNSPSININDRIISGSQTYRQCAYSQAVNDTSNGAHWSLDNSPKCKSPAQNECLWSYDAARTPEAQLDTCVDRWWAEPNIPGNHHAIMANPARKYLACAVYISPGNKRFSVAANFYTAAP